MSDQITYRDAGVDIDAGNEAVKRIKKILSKSTRIVDGGEEVGGVGGFSAFFRPFLEGYEDPLLVASTDGVGTKLLLALEHKKLDRVGQDLVAMIVNDIIVTGARPLFFLDYIATGKLDPDEIETIIKSIQKACEESECLLIGGECAEMPGMYAPGHTDLAGFGVGIVDKTKAITGEGVAEGDIVLGLPSSGLHSNGFSLVRKVIEREGWKCDEKLPDCDEVLLDILLKPTRLYVKTLLRLFRKMGTGPKGGVKACAHITGGGIIENIPRVIPNKLGVAIDRGSWPAQTIFGMLQEAAKLGDEELYRTFNCGIGFVLVVSPDDAGRVEAFLHDLGEVVYRIGKITSRPVNRPHLVFN